MELLWQEGGQTDKDGHEEMACEDMVSAGQTDKDGHEEMACEDMVFAGQTNKDGHEEMGSEEQRDKAVVDSEKEETEWEMDMDVPDPPKVLSFHEPVPTPPQKLDYYMDGFDYDTMCKLLEEDDYDYMFELQRATLHQQFRSFYKDTFLQLKLEDEDLALTFAWGDDASSDGLADLWEFINWLRCHAPPKCEPCPEPTQPLELSEKSGEVCEVFTLEQLINKARESVEHKKTAKGGKKFDVFDMEQVVIDVVHHMSLSDESLAQLMSAAQKHPLMIEHELDMTCSAGSDHSGEVWKFGQDPDMKGNLNDLVQFIVWLLGQWTEQEGSGADVEQPHAPVAETNEKKNNQNNNDNGKDEKDTTNSNKENVVKQENKFVQDDLDRSVNVDKSILSSSV